MYQKKNPLSLKMTYRIVGSYEKRFLSRWGGGGGGGGGEVNCR